MLAFIYCGIYCGNDAVKIPVTDRSIGRSAVPGVLTSSMLRPHEMPDCEPYYLRYRSGRNSLHAKFDNTENQRCFVQTRSRYVDARVLFTVMPFGLRYCTKFPAALKHRENTDSRTWRGLIARARARASELVASGVARDAADLLNY